MKLLVALGCLFLLGCGSAVTRELDPQAGVTSVQDAVLRWGAPDYQRKTADGGTEMVWRSRTRPAPQHEYVHPRGLTYGGAAGGFSQQAETLTVVFDRRGIIQSWDSQRR
jgi:hypothetical protein